MTLRLTGFLALVFTALAMVPYGAHLFALPNKIGMTEQQYFIAQAAYNGWARLGFILFPAMALNILFAVLMRGEGIAFSLAIAACVLMASTLAIFMTWTQPANAATQNWTVVPANWAELRQQWEYSCRSAAWRSRRYGRDAERHCATSGRHRYARPKASRSSSLAWLRIFLRPAERFLPARLM
jgi:hypothetical protein